MESELHDDVTTLYYSGKQLLKHKQTYKEHFILRCYGLKNKLIINASNSGLCFFGHWAYFQNTQNRLLFKSGFIIYWILGSV